MKSLFGTLITVIGASFMVSPLTLAAPPIPAPGTTPSGLPIRQQAFLDVKATWDKGTVLDEKALTGRWKLAAYLPNEACGFLGRPLFRART